MATRMQQRRGTAAQWISTNNGNGPILEAGEIGFESDTSRFKIGDGVNHWVDLVYFKNADDVLSAINNLVDGAPNLLNTLNEIAAAIADDPNFFATVATNLSNHEADTTNVHGIVNTAELATKTFAAELLTNATKNNIVITGDKNGLIITAENGVADSTTDNLVEGTTNKYFTNERAQDAVGDNLGDGLSYDDNTGSISVTANTYDAYGAASAVATNLSSHESATLNVHGIADTDELATKTYVANAIGDATVDQSALAGVGIDWNGSTEQFDIDSTVTTNTGTQTLENKTLTSPKINEDVVLTATATELNTLDGITASTAELNYVDGVTGPIQDQLNDKAPLNSPALTGTPTAPTANAGTNNTQVATTAYVDTAVANLVDSAPEALNTLNELAAALGDDNNFATSVSTAIGEKVAKAGDTMTGDLTLHADPTSNLHAATKQYVDTAKTDAESTASNALNNAVTILEGQIQNAESDANSYTDAALTNYTPTNNLDLTVGNYGYIKSDALNPYATDTDLNNAIDGLSGNVTVVVNGNLDVLTGTGITTGAGSIEVDFAELDTRYDALGEADAAEQAANLYTDNAITALDLPNTYDSKGAALAVQNNLDDHALDTVTHGVSGNIVGTSDAQTLTNKTISHVDNTLTVQVANVSDLTATATELNTLDGITASTTELNYVDGVTSSIQSQIDSKAPLASPTFTGTATTNHLIVDGDFTVNGTNFAASATSITIEDNIVQLAHQNPANTVDLGLVVGYNDGTAKHAGLVKDVSDAKWKLFKDVTSEPSTTVDFTQGTLDTLAVATLEGNVTGNLTGDVIGNADTATALETPRNIAGQSFDGTTDISIAPTDLTGVTATAAEINILDGATLTTTELNYVDGVTSAIQDQIDSKLSSSTAASTYAPIASPTFTGTVSGITSSMVGLGNVDNTSDVNKPISTATQSALDLKANLNAPTFTGTVILPETTAIGNVSATEIGHLDGVTSAIQTQLDSKLASTTAASTYAPLVSPTFTGTVSGITASMVGLGNVDNTSDANKPVSNATQSALDLKAPLASPTFTGVITTPLSTAGYVKTNASGVLSSSSAIPQSDVTSLTSDLALKAPLASPALTGTPTAPTANAGTNTTQIATTEFVSTAVANLIDSAPGALDTLNELAAAIGDDANYASTITNALALKAPLASPTFTGTVTLPNETVTSAMIANGTIVNDDISTTAAIAQSKIENLTTDLAAKASLTGAETLTNKTLTSPVINNPTITASYLTDGTTNYSTSGYFQESYPWDYAAGQTYSSSVSAVSYDTATKILVVSFTSSSSPSDLYAANNNNGVTTPYVIDNISISGSATTISSDGNVRTATINLNNFPPALDTSNIENVVFVFFAGSAAITLPFSYSLVNATATISSTEMRYLDGATSNIQTQIDNLLPDTSANTSGKYLTNNGTTVSWAAVDALPAQSGETTTNLAELLQISNYMPSFTYDHENQGDFISVSMMGPISSAGLTAFNNAITSGSEITLEHVSPARTDSIVLTITGPAAEYMGMGVIRIPATYVSPATIYFSGSGSTTISYLASNAGKFLTTDGTTASWASISIPAGISTSSTFTANSGITVLDTLAAGDAAEYTIRIKNGSSATRVSKVIAAAQMMGDEYVEFGILQVGSFGGGPYDPEIKFESNMMSGNRELKIINNDLMTSYDVKVIKTLL